MCCVRVREHSVPVHRERGRERTEKGDGDGDGEGGGGVGMVLYSREMRKGCGGSLLGGVSEGVCMV